MRNVLFTGGSSFTGYWFITELLKADFTVHVAFRKPEIYYTGSDVTKLNEMRKVRVNFLLDLEKKNPDKLILHWDMPFGETEFIKLICDSGINFNLFCYHNFNTHWYNNENYNIWDSAKESSNNLSHVIRCLSKIANCKKVIYTGSYFQPNVCFDYLGDQAMTPYGLCKHFVYELLQRECFKQKMDLGMFVIPNPFGPYENMKLTTKLIINWFSNKSLSIDNFKNIRDNIHVSLLSKCYAAYALEMINYRNPAKIMSPSGYALTQYEFISKFRDEFLKAVNGTFFMDKTLTAPMPVEELLYNNNNNARIDVPCRKNSVEAKQILSHISASREDGMALSFAWNETDAWQELMDFYFNFYYKRRKTPVL